MRTLILTLLVLIAAPSVASAGILAHLKKQPGDLPKPHALKKGADPQNPKKHKLFHKHHHGHGCDECYEGGHGHHHGHGLFHHFHH
jgi:hypothetical protein